MSNNLTVSDLHRDLEQLRRTNNWGNAMISTRIDRMNRDVNYSIVGSSMMLYSQLGEMSDQNSKAYSNMSANIRGLSYDISESASLITERLSSSIKDAENTITTQIKLSTAKLQLSLDNVQDAVEQVNKQIQELVSESKVQTSILAHINEGIHNPEIQKTNNGIEDFEMRNFESAVQSFNAALTFRLSLYLPHYFLGLIHSEKGEDNNVYDIDKAEKEIKDAIFYGMKLIDKNDDVRSYMILAHRAYANILRQKGNCSEALEQLDKGVGLSKDVLGTRLLYLEEYIKCFNSLGEKEKALVYVRLGLENDASFVSLLLDEDLANLREDILKVIEELNVEFADVIYDLILKTDDFDLILKINTLVSEDDAKTFLGRSKIISMLKMGNK